ncbi:MAG: pilin [Gallionella sp.]
MYCPKCGVANDDTATFCKACGEVLPLPAGKFQKAQGGSGVPTGIEAYYKAVLGPKNQYYYLDRFARFDAEGKTSATWHWPAFFVTFYWLLYRKMWLAALGYFFLPSLLFWLVRGIMAAATHGPAYMLVGAWNLVYSAGILFLPPMYANALYYNHCKKKIAAARAASADTQMQLGELSDRGGTSNIAIIILLFFVFFAFLGIVAAVAIPAYQDYTTRARVAQAYELGRSAEESVGNYCKRNQTLPGNLGEAGFAASLPPSVSGISMDTRNGTLTIIMKGAIIDGKSLELEPALDENKQLYWHCMSPDLQDRYLPRACRRNN